MKKIFVQTLTVLYLVVSLFSPIFAKDFCEHKLEIISLENVIYDNDTYRKIVYSVDDEKMMVYINDKELLVYDEANNLVGYQDMKMTINRPDSVQKLTFTYVYDENINPKKNFFSLLLDHVLLNDEPQTFFCSANNAVGIYVTDTYDIFSETYSFTYAYDYYKKYPTKIYSTSLDEETFMEKKELIYSYEYQY